MKKPAQPSAQDALYQTAVDAHAADIARFVSGYEYSTGKRQELLQEVHLALWQSMAGYRSQCSLRTWVYRVAHNVGVSHVQRSRRSAERNGSALDDIAPIVDEQTDISLLDRELDLGKVMSLVHSLAALDREVMLLYLEDLDAAAIGEVTGLSARNVATKVHRIKTLLANRLDARSAAP
jgi:RNA polymerase sigma-70 factor (ECF subfamily)